MGRKGTISGTKGGRHRQKWFRSGKRAPSRTRRASFFCRKDAKTDEKGAVMEGKGAPSLTLKGAISAQRGAISVPKSVVTAR